MAKAMRSPVRREVINTVAPIAQDTSSKAINGNITKIKAAFGKINTLVQQTIVQVITHASLYGDCTGAARLLDAMPKSSRRNLVQLHFQKYSPIAVHLDKKTGKMKAHLRTEDSKQYNAFNVDAARANNWYESVEAEKEPDVLTIEDFKTQAERFIARMKKMAEDEKHVAKADRKAVKETVAKLSMDLLKAFEPEEIKF